MHDTTGESGFEFPLLPVVGPTDQSSEVTGGAFTGEPEVEPEAPAPTFAIPRSALILEDEEYMSGHPNFPGGFLGGD